MVKNPRNIDLSNLQIINWSFAGSDGPSSHEGQFDFDPAHVDARAAVEAFMQNHIAKADWDVAP